jgi:prevent-host-death family protein
MLLKQRMKSANIAIETISSTTLQQEVGRVTKRVYKDKRHIIVERGGFPIVAIIPIDEYQTLYNKQKSPVIKPAK